MKLLNIVKSSQTAAAEAFTHHWTNIRPHNKKQNQMAMKKQHSYLVTLGNRKFWISANEEDKASL